MKPILEYIMDNDTCLRCKNVTTFCTCETPIYDYDKYIDELESKINLVFEKLTKLPRYSMSPVGTPRPVGGRPIISNYGPYLERDDVINAYCNIMKIKLNELELMSF